MKMKSLGLIIVLTVLWSCGQKETSVRKETPVGAVAAVGDVWILESDVKHLQNTVQTVSSEDALNRLIEEETLVQSALREGLNEDPSIRAAMRRLLASRYLEKHLREPQTVTDAEVEAAWKADRFRFALPASVRLAVIRRSLTDSSEDDARALLNKLAEDYQNDSALHAAPGFGALAASYSDQQDTRYQGGDCGWVQSGRRHLLLPDAVIYAAAKATKEGVLGEIVIADEAAWLVQVTEKREASRVPLARAASQIRHELEARAVSRARDLVIKNAASETSVSVLRELEDEPTDARALVEAMPLGLPQ